MQPLLIHYSFTLKIEPLTRNVIRQMLQTRIGGKCSFLSKEVEMINESLLKIKVREEKGKRNYSKMAKISNLKSCCIGKFLSFRDSLGGPSSQLSFLRIC